MKLSVPGVGKWQIKEQICTKRQKMIRRGVWQKRAQRICCVAFKSSFTIEIEMSRVKKNIITLYFWDLKGLGKKWLNKTSGLLVYTQEEKQSSYLYLKSLHQSKTWNCQINVMPLRVNVVCRAGFLQEAFFCMCNQMFQSVSKRCVLTKIPEKKT